MTEPQWRKSSYSGGQGECVEVKPDPELVEVRDTKDRAGGTLAVDGDAWTAFLARI
ncbi:DUF397 domain-containing protein [Amycolatopsis sp. DSM 110486]|uniref:DUF397 domain-containing protein n=1 Tax=Amycolatopsis sp. DSM 110486 TaxID=2865832 RepID=UPI001C69E999|nr:DUF397 domain-containing protein [Amycolatopsis sp. DSM 110486]QYN17480.1 DUF397 domain-containing protein [Amycolatopsis sp. DSM 110486]